MMSDMPLPSKTRSRFLHLLTRFGRDCRATAAIEFGAVGLVLIMVILAVIQFGLYFMCQVSLHNAMASLATGTQTAAVSARNTAINVICPELTLADQCSTSILLEKAPVQSYPTSGQAITGATFITGKAGDMMLLRAQVKVVTFVPFLPKLSVRGAAVFAGP